MQKILFIIALSSLTALGMDLPLDTKSAWIFHADPGDQEEKLDTHQPLKGIISKGKEYELQQFIRNSLSSSNAEITLSRKDSIKYFGDIFLTIPEIARSGARIFLLEVWGPVADDTLNALALEIDAQVSQMAYPIFNFKPMTLKKLCLNGIVGEKKSIHNFFNALSEDRHIEELIFEIKGMRDDEAIVIASSLLNNKTLKKVSIHGGFTEYALILFGEALSTNKTLEHFKLFGLLAMEKNFVLFNEAAGRFFTNLRWVITASDNKTNVATISSDTGSLKRSPSKGKKKPSSEVQ